MKVLKFGGTSVGSAEGLRQVKLVVESCREEVIVVVSALGGITDQLLLTSRMAAAGDMQYKSQLEQIVMRHRRTVDEVVDPACRAEVLATVNTLLDELSNIFKGVYLIKDLSPKTSDAIVSYGERLSSVIVRGVLGCAELYDAREFIKTRPYFGKHIVEFAPTEKLIRERFAAMPKVVVVPGFIAADYQSDDVTNLGRGGSDYTASVLAATLKADALEIWTDVDGFMTADPKVISNAYVIDLLLFCCNWSRSVPTSRTAGTVDGLRSLFSYSDVWMRLELVWQTKLVKHLKYQRNMLQRPFGTDIKNQGRTASFCPEGKLD